MFLLKSPHIINSTCPEEHTKPYVTTLLTELNKNTSSSNTKNYNLYFLTKTPLPLRPPKHQKRAISMSRRKTPHHQPGRGKKKVEIKKITPIIQIVVKISSNICIKQHFMVAECIIALHHVLCVQIFTMNIIKIPKQKRGLFSRN